MNVILNDALQQTYESRFDQMSSSKFVNELAVHNGTMFSYMGRAFIYEGLRFEGSDINYISQGMAWAQFTHGNTVGLVGAMGFNAGYNAFSIVVKPFIGTSSWNSAQRDLAQAAYTGHKFSQLGFKFYNSNTQ